MPSLNHMMYFFYVGKISSSSNRPSNPMIDIKISLYKSIIPSTVITDIKVSLHSADTNHFYIQKVFIFS